MERYPSNRLQPQPSTRRRFDKYQPTDEEVSTLSDESCQEMVLKLLDNSPLSELPVQLTQQHWELVARCPQCTRQLLHDVYLDQGKLLGMQFSGYDLVQLVNVRRTRRRLQQKHPLARLGFAEKGENLTLERARFTPENAIDEQSNDERPPSPVRKLSSRNSAPCHMSTRPA